MELVAWMQLGGTEQSGKKVGCNGLRRWKHASGIETFPWLVGRAVGWIDGSTRRAR